MFGNAECFHKWLLSILLSTFPNEDMLDFTKILPPATADRQNHQVSLFLQWFTLQHQPLTRPAENGP